MEERLTYLREQLANAIADFERSLRIRPDDYAPEVADTIRNGQVQKFEFTIELFWKTAKVFLLEVHGFDLPGPKPIVKKYFESGYIDYKACESLLCALEIRNSLSHVYKKEAFAALYEEVSGFAGFFGPAAEGMLHAA